jgi:choloylglycine hydrolase
MIVIGLLLLVNTAWACSVVSVDAVGKQGACTGLGECDHGDEVKFTARTMELNFDFPYYLSTTPEGTYFPADFPYCGQGTPWTSTYNFLSINMDYECDSDSEKLYCLFAPEENPDFFKGHEALWAFDGINEEGLSVSALAFTHAFYEKPEDERTKETTSVCYSEFVAYALSNFKDIDSLEKHMKEPGFVMMNKVPEVFGLQFHWSVQDATGRDVVIEYNYHMPGKVQFYENTVGVMTNNPDFEWHVMNLNNYANMNIRGDPAFPTGSQKKNFAWVQEGKPMMVPNQIGTGTNMNGLPGDISPPSRFVKLFYTKAAVVAHEPPVVKENVPASGLAIVQNLIQQVWIPRGLETVHHLGHFKLQGYTQWTVVKVPRQRKFYYKGYADHRWRVVDLSQLTKEDYHSNFQDTLIDFQNYEMDMTKKFQEKNTPNQIPPHLQGRASASTKKAATILQKLLDLMEE